FSEPSLPVKHNRMNLKDKKVLIFGGAGFIGSHLTERLIHQGASVTVFDNLKTGRTANLDKVRQHPGFRFIQADVSSRKQVDEIVPGHEVIFHFCDDSDIRSAAEHPDTFVEQNIMGLFYVLEAMRRNGIRLILFPSSTTVFGELANPPASESHGPMIPLNLYGGAKLAAEGLISAWAHTYDFCAVVFRFVGIIGGRMDHGVVHDFVRKLQKDPKQLEILGDGTQKRSFVLVDDCVDAMLFSLARAAKNFNLVHIGNVDQISIAEAAEVIFHVMKLKNVELRPTGGKVGWKGDVTSNFIATETLTAWGWKPRHTSREAVFEAAGRLALEKGRQ
ncbi:MAG TPA: SDR family NAD(P)-dependent oxidoreductase, partial [Verrucomicrobiae bacterium]|nr:SDR family NAD(P)-dependent oxidoreductase [Verrucomicrobiae bacterium]